MPGRCVQYFGLENYSFFALGLVSKMEHIRDRGIKFIKLLPQKEPDGVQYLGNGVYKNVRWLTPAKIRELYPDKSGKKKDD